MILFFWLKEKHFKQSEDYGRCAVVICARNEEDVIADAVSDLLNNQNYPRDRFDVYVVADNCTDHTAEEAERSLALYREYFSPIGIFENRVYDEVPELLEKLKNDGYTIVLATSKPRVYAGRILGKFDLMKYFSGVFGSELDGTRDKKEDVIAYALETLGASPDDVIMVGDRLHDVLGASANGVKTIGVLYGYGSREELAAAGAIALADDVNELYKCIKRV